jgi:3-oxoacyl-[acyl-carrier protein] reductase
MQIWGKVMRLLDKVAIVTGAGRGIGRTIALTFAREGADVVVVSRTFSEVEETASQIRALGRRALALKVDISRTEDVDNMVKSALQKFGRIDVLVSNAGILGPIGPLVENDVEHWAETIKVNLIGTFLCCKIVLPIMIKQGWGKIIHLSGGGAAYPRPRFSAYAASKAAVVRLTETLAEEVKEYNIQVNAIAPGAISTRLHQEILAAGDNAGETALAETKKVIETGGTPSAVPAALAVFLASDESDGLTGKLISAVWDDWQNMGKRASEIVSSDLYTLRRVTK